MAKYNPVGKMWTDTETIEVDESIDSLVKAMRFKAKHIKAKADPAVFDAVADAIENMLTAIWMD